MCFLCRFLLIAWISGICLSKCPEGWTAQEESNSDICVLESSIPEGESYYHSNAHCASLCGNEILQKGYRCPRLPTRDFVSSTANGTPYWRREVLQGNFSTDHCTDTLITESPPNTEQAKCTIVNEQREELVSCSENLALRILCIMERLTQPAFQKEAMSAVLAGKEINFREIMDESTEDLQRIKHQNMVDYINSSPGVTWKAEFNPSAVFETFRDPAFSGYSPEMVAPTDLVNTTHGMHSGIFSASSTAAYINELFEDALASLPSSFDAREAWPKCTSIRRPTTNQGSCGSCWAVSAAAAISDRICIHTNQTIDVNVSPQQFISCVKKSCYGDHAEIAFSHWIENGVVTGGEFGSEDGCYPYEHHSKCGGPCSIKFILKKPDPKPCATECRPLYGKSYEEDLHYGKVYYNVQGKEDRHDIYSKERNMMRELKERGPFLTGFQVTEDFFHYKSGVYQRVTGDLVYGHSVKVIGWGTENGHKYWMAANSWGRDWGDRGFFKFIRGINHLMFGEEAIAGLPMPLN